MPYGQFVLCNLAGATVWALVMVSLSYILGQIIPLEVLIQGFVQFRFGRSFSSGCLVIFSSTLEAI